MRSATLRSSPLTSTPKLNITRIGGMNRSRFGCLIALNATPGKRAEAKANLLSLISRVDRGLSASPEDQSRIESAAIQVELLNPEKEPLKSSLLNGKWRLVYTTSASVLGKDRPEWLRPKGSTFQVIDAGKLRAKNIEGPPTFSSVEAELTVENRDTVQVKFTQFNIGGFIPIKPKNGSAGELKITYLDQEVRISRGNRGNLFVLVQDDPGFRL